MGPGSWKDNDFGNPDAGNRAHCQEVCGCASCHRQSSLWSTCHSHVEDVHGFPAKRPAAALQQTFGGFWSWSRWHEFCEVLHAIITTTSHLKAGSVEQLKLQQWSAAFLLRLGCKSFVPGLAPVYRQMSRGSLRRFNAHPWQPRLFVVLVTSLGRGLTITFIIIMQESAGLLKGIARVSGHKEAVFFLSSRS